MLKQFFSYYKPYKRLFLIDFMCAIISAVLELIFPIAVNRVIDEVLPDGNLKMIIMFSVLLFTMYLFNMWMNYIVVALGHEFGINVETDMRRDLFDHYQKQSYTYFDNVKTGELLSRVTTDLFDISEVAHHGPEDVFITIMTLLGAFLLMLNVHVPLAVITVFLLPLMGIALFVFNKKMTQVNTRIFSNVAKFTAGIGNSLSGIRVVKAFANEAHEKKIFEGYNQGFRENKLAFYKTMAISSSFNYILVRLINLFAFLAGSYYTVIGELSLGELVGFILLANVFVRPLEKINNMIELYPKGYAGFKRFSKELKRKPDIVDQPDAYPAPAFKGDIEYHQVSFAYEDGKTVVADANLSIKSGETIAFVGPSGAGKTTLVNLLPRFYEVTSGAITIDGHNIQDVTMESLRKQIGIVQQDVFLFTGTVRENVLYGRLDATPEEVEAAIDAARLREVVEDLPQGLDTEIGERGVRLSGGQKQRLSIARIFLKNPSILILDEATSALDTQTEQFIQASLDKLAQGRTTLIIAHRLATIRHADRIIVVTPDGITEDGTHDELIALKGHYAELYFAQYGRDNGGVE
ncbi:ATP-binding cassette domain-containing protein [Aerococcaceae bacterium WS4759]|uniref:Multidrug resistance ABC transporter ATP-binding and permease protein n=1 Tax=Fundicoccus ignavus TaxID=2664442 RepID=A0A6I2GGM8_9LACT|nr:ABC transporter ATP-binding protein [Fundicoccus ignavus]MRI84671.1 ATP-binding cassette domain-containing protein [Fundicoccus ignavus]